MRKLLLMSAVSIGLIAGANVTQAQPNRDAGQAVEQPKAQERGGGQPSQHTSPGPRQQGASGTNAERNGRPQTTGQAEPGRSDRDRPAARQVPDGGRSEHRETTGQAPAERRDLNRNNAAQNPARDTTGQAVGREPGRQGPSRETTGQGGRTPAALTLEQRTKIRTTILREQVRPAANVNFNVGVGAVVPRTVEIHPVPVEIVQIEPAWRGYMFFLVGDEIVIVDPGTMRIVSVLPA